jgi:hypothetical protein
MRILHVLEVRDHVGRFQPKIGFERPEMVMKWLRRYLAAHALLTNDDWRIVEYEPREETNGEVN